MFWAQEVCNLQFRWLRPAISTVAIVTFAHTFRSVADIPELGLLDLQDCQLLALENSRGPEPSTRFGVYIFAKPKASVS